MQDGSNGHAPALADLAKRAEATALHMTFVTQELDHRSRRFRERLRRRKSHYKRWLYIGGAALLAVGAAAVVGRIRAARREREGIELLRRIAARLGT